MIIDVIVSNNDSTMQAVLNHPPKVAQGQFLKSSKVKLDEVIPEPYFLADTFHHVKVVAKHIFPPSTKVGLSDVDEPEKIISYSRNIGGTR